VPNKYFRRTDMRETMFRGKWKLNGKWVYGYYKKADRVEYIYVEGETVFDTGWAEIIPETVGQYTGLRDRNSARIFEGDILQKDDGFVSYRTFVKWDNEHCGFIYNYIPQKYAPHEGVMTVSLYHFCPDEHKIIGNIHDNPELLRERAE
jgi:uncharacterized phage protein (TIGR01671 family)